MSQKWVAVPWEEFEELKAGNLNLDERDREQQGGGDTPALSIEILLATIPRQYHRQATAILNHIQKAQNLSWNKEGELLVDGKVIPHTHISDLIKDSFYKYKHWEPEAVDIFYKELAKSNLPAGLVRNQERRTALLLARSQNNLPGPPGVLASTWLTWK